MKKQFSLLILFFILVSCGQKEIKNTDQIAQINLSAISGAQQVTNIGRNSQPQFSPSGDRLLFVSQDRQAHKNPQAYEYDIKTNRERRLTFQSGEVNYPLYLSDKQIIYASNTDEIKEKIDTENEDMRQLASFDLYLSDLYGNEIVRLTTTRGYDSEPTLFSKNQKTIIFVSKENGKSLLKKLNLNEQKALSYLSTPGLDLSSPTATGDGKMLAWIETNAETKKQRLMGHMLARKKVEILLEAEGEYRDLRIWPEKNRLVYSYRKSPQEPYKIEATDIEAKCRRVLINSTDSLIQPSIASGSPDVLAFTRESSQGSQIYFMPLPNTLCEPLNSNISQ